MHYRASPCSLLAGGDPARGAPVTEERHRKLLRAPLPVRHHAGEVWCSPLRRPRMTGLFAVPFGPRAIWLQGYRDGGHHPQRRAVLSPPGRPAPHQTSSARRQAGVFTSRLGGGASRQVRLLPGRAVLPRTGGGGSPDGGSPASGADVPVSPSTIVILASSCPSTRVRCAGRRTI